MPAGTPRGFNLQNFGMGNNGMPPMQIGQFAPFFASNMQAPNGGGPIRRGAGGNRPNTRPGPYDRRPNQRYGDGNGRLSPPPGARRAMGGGRWGDGAQGVPAPREAVQGRSLKSYEDLDAVAGGGGGELNY